MPTPLPVRPLYLRMVALVRTLLVTAPVIDSMVLAVRVVTRLGETLTTPGRCASARTRPALICTVIARIDGCTACTEPPLASTQARKSVISGSVESLTTMACTWRTPFMSRAHLALGASTRSASSPRSRAIFSLLSKPDGRACAFAGANPVASTASAVSVASSRRARRRRSMRTMNGVKIEAMICIPWFRLAFTVAGLAATATSMCAIVKGSTQL